MIIGLDVGGTHTDAVLLGADGILNQVKVPTDTTNLFQTVWSGLERLTEGLPPSGIHRIVLSTTLATNAVIQQKLPKVGMVVSAGPGLDPSFFPTNDHYFPVSGSIDHRGREMAPLELNEIESIASRLHSAGIEYAGVVSKFSPRNPAHELRMADILADRVKKVFTGHAISGHLNFPRRVATTFLNAAVFPIHRNFFSAVEHSLVERGLSVPIRILKADGGNTNFRSSLEYPAQTVFSGPAASVMGAIVHAPLKGECLVLDIGGTTTDMAVLIDRSPLLDPLGIELGGYKTLIRALKTYSIGLGGDSAITGSKGVLTIGPERRGPAMAFGGPTPTPTDALCVLGQFAAGDREQSVRGLMPLASQMGLSVEALALRIFNQVCQTIIAEAQAMIDRINAQPVYTVHEMLDGYRVKPDSMLVLGGPAPQFAQKLQEISAFRVDVVPNPEVANAIGAALARTTCEVTLLVDTERKIALAPNDGYQQTISSTLNKDAALEIAYSLLRKKAIARGAKPEGLEMEVLEQQQFNMVRGFHTSGKQIRIRVQVKPGLIKGSRFPNTTSGNGA